MIELNRKKIIHLLENRENFFSPKYKIIKVNGPLNPNLIWGQAKQWKIYKLETLNYS